jgi:hypothetical protein
LPGASAQIAAERESAKARRLYRLIIENTTDLISRHTPTAVSRCFAGFLGLAGVLAGELRGRWHNACSIARAWRPWCGGPGKAWSRTVITP